MRWGREEHESKHQHQQLHKKHTEKQHNQRSLDKKLTEKQQNHRHQLQSQKNRETWLQPPVPLPPQSNHHHHQQQQQQHYPHQRLHDKEEQPQQQQQLQPHHHQNQQDKEGRSSSSSSSSSTPFSLFAPTSWISKLKHTLHHPSKNTTTKSHQHPIPKPHLIHIHHLNSPHPTIKPYKPDPATQPTSQHHHRTKLDKSATARPRPTTPTGSPPPPASKSHQVQPLSPAHTAARTSSVSDKYISFLPADLDDGVFLLPARRSYERLVPSGPATVYDANVDRRRRGLCFAFDPFGSSDAATAVPQLTRSESAKINRVASDITTETTARTSPHPRKKPAKTRRDDFFSLFSAVPDTIRRINTTTTTTPSQSSSSVSTATTTAPRGSRLSQDSAHQAPEPRRRSFSAATGHKLKRKSKLRVHSPRVGAAASNKKPAEKLVQRKTQETPAGKTTTTASAAPHIQLESFAVVKCSSDPRRDFRDSMLEMITELDMARPDQLEGLLACYLSLNADEYHDVIVRVFRQVWLDLILDTASSTSPPNHHQRASA